MLIVRLTKDVRSEIPGRTSIVCKGEIIEAERNAQGAVSAIARGGNTLGLRANEYDILRDDASFAQLKTSIAKLPKCWRLNEEGELVQDVLVLPGMKLWSTDLGGPHRMEVMSLDDLGSDWPATVRTDFQKAGQASTYRWHVQACSSTLEAANAQMRRRKGDR